MQKFGDHCAVVFVKYYFIYRIAGICGELVKILGSGALILKRIIVHGIGTCIKTERNSDVFRLFEYFADYSIFLRCEAVKRINQNIAVCEEIVFAEYICRF